MEVKKYLSNITAFTLICVLALTNILSCFPSMPGKVNAASKTYTLYSRHAKYNGLAIEELGHSSTTPFRFFKMNTDDGVKRVFCGYSEGRGHEGDSYKKKVVNAVDWKPASDSALYGKNTKSIARALIYYYDEVGSSNASDFLETVLQTYIWAKSMGRNTEKALKQMSSSLNVSYTNKVLPIINKIKKVELRGKIEIYSHTGTCVGSEGQTLTHQPYYRWIDNTPYKKTLSTTDKATKTISVDISVIKKDSKTGKPVPGTKIQIKTKTASGSPDNKTYTTDANGKINFDYDRSYSATGSSGTFKYVTNWSSLGKQTKEKLTKAGYYQNRSLAYAAAKAKAKQAAVNNLNKKIAALPKYPWTFTEQSAPGHYVLTNKSKVTKYQTTTTSKISVSFTNAPKRGSITIKKEASTDKYNSKYSLAGAEFDLIAAEDLTGLDGTAISKDTVIQSVIIPKSGTAKVSNLPIGNYIVKETEAPDGFVLDTTEYPVEIVDDSAAKPNTSTIPTVTVTVTNTPKIGSLSFTKYKGDGAVTTPEPGIEFRLRSIQTLADGTYYEETRTSDANGAVSWDNVPYGDYTLTQVTIPSDSYPLNEKIITIDDDNQTITLPASQTTDLIKQPGKVIVEKVTVTPLTYGDEDVAADNTYPTIKKPEPNAVFQIIKDGTVVSEMTTDAAGRAVSETLDPGTYTLHQASGTPGFEMVEDKVFTITETDTDSIQYYLENPRKGSHLEIEKVKVPRTDDGGYEEEVPESNAEFYVLDLDKVAKSEFSGWKDLSTEEKEAFITAHQDGVIGDKMTTGKNGKAELWFPEDYQLTDKGFVILQTKGTDGYKMLNPVYSTDDDVAQINKGSVVSYTYKGQNVGKFYYAMAKIKKTKVMDEDGNTAPEANATFKLYKSDGTEFGEYTTDANGEFYIPFLLQDDYLLEQTAGSETHDFISPEDGNLFVVSQDCIMEESRMQEFVDSGYDENILTAEEKEMLKNLSYDLKNEPKPAYIKIKKQSTYTGKLLNDTVFTLYKKVEQENGSKKYEKYTTLTTGAYPEDADESLIQELIGKVECELEYGTYLLRETQAPEGYLLTETDTGKESSDEDFPYQEFEFTIDGNHVVQNADGTLVYSADLAEGETVFEFKDTPIMGKISVTKNGPVISTFVDPDSGFESETKGLPGATYGLYAAENIYDDNGTLIHEKDSLIDQKVTGDDGNVFFTRTDTYTGKTTDYFFLGNYYVKELEAPKGYTLDTKTYSIALTADATAGKANDLSENTGLPGEEQGIASSHGNYFLTTGPKLNPLIQDATKVIFTHVTAPADATTTDVSADKDGTVVMWNEDTVYYISSQVSDQVIYFNVNSSEMFKNCTELTEIVFANIDTSYMAYASEMFMNDRALTTLDLSNFNTGRVTNTVSMFQGSNLLETIYIGDTEQVSPDEEEAEVTGIAAYPVAKHLYYNPDSINDEENTSTEEADMNRFCAEDFNFVYLYSDGSADELDITDNDILSILPEFPYFDDGVTKSGKLEVTITLKADSEFALNGEETEIKTKVTVIDPDTLDLKPVVEEHPTAQADVSNNQKLISAVVRKVSVADPDTTLSGAVFTITAATTLVDKDGNVLLNEGDVVTTINSLDNKTGDGGDAAAPNLPTGLYAQDKNAPYLYKITETKAPVGFKKTDHVAFIPNIDLTSEPDKTQMETLASAYDDITVNFKNDDEATYEFEFTFKDETCATIAKLWDGDPVVPENERPDSLTIRAYSDEAKTNLVKTFTLTAENNWTAEWPDMPSDDIEDFTFEEVIPAGVNWEQEGYKKYDKNDDKHPNTVWFTNKGLDVDPTVQLTVTKVWDDSDNRDNLRPDEVFVNLLCNGEEVSGYQKVSLNETNNWSITTDELPKYGETGKENRYTWEEDRSKNSPNLTFLTDDATTGYVENVEVNGNDTIITNTHINMTAAAVEKEWDDQNDHYQVRPDSIEAGLYADGEKVTSFTLETTDVASGQTTSSQVSDGVVVLNEANAWSAKAVNLPRNKDGHDIQYEWKEETVPAHYTQSSNTTSDTDTGFVTKLTNSCTVQPGQIHVEKRIDKKVYDAMTDKPSFTFTLKGTDMYGHAYETTQTTAFNDPDQVTHQTGSDYVTVSADFTDLEMGTYILSENASNAFILDAVTDIENGTLETDSAGNPVVAFEITPDNASAGMSAAFKNIPNQGRLKVVKYDADGTTPLEGVEFALTSKANPDADSFTGTTDSNGEITFDKIPCGDYVLTETKTVKGHTLLTEPIDITFPLALTEQEMTDNHVDASKAIYSVKSGKYHIYSLTYEVTNHANLVLPKTGMDSSPWLYLPAILGCLLIIITLYKQNKSPA